MAASPSEPSTGGARARDTGVPTASGQRPRQPRPLLAPHAKWNSWCGMVPTQASGRVALDFGRGRWLEGRAAAGQCCRRWDRSGPCSGLGGGMGHLVSPGHWRAQAPARDTEAGSCCQPAVAALGQVSCGRALVSPSGKRTILPPVSVLGKFCHLLTVHYLPLPAHFKENHGAKGSPSGLEGEGLPLVQQPSSCPWASPVAGRPLPRACKHLGQAPPSPGRPSPQASAPPPPLLLARLPGQREAAEGCPRAGQTSRLEQEGGLGEEGPLRSSVRGPAKEGQ